MMPNDEKDIPPRIDSPAGYPHPQAEGKPVLSTGQWLVKTFLTIIITIAILYVLFWVGVFVIIGD